MRSLAHCLLAVTFWVVLVACWVVLAIERQATGTALRDTGLRLAVLMGAVLAVTLWWVRHNVGIYRRKGPRTGRPAEEPRTDLDRLGRRLEWAMAGGTDAARSQARLVVELDGDAKVYR